MSQNILQPEAKHAATADGRIAQSDRIPIFQKIMFSAGAGMDYVAVGLTIGVLWMPYFNIGFGLNPTLLGVIMMLLQAWNAVIDPIMGNWSDNARTRWGRRRPFMVVGSVLTACIFIFLWRPPDGLSPVGISVYLGIVGFLFFTTFSAWAMPYYGMQLELTPNYDERTRLTAWTTLFNKIISLLSGWILALISGPWFVNEQTGQPDIVHGMKTCSWFIAALILGFGLLPPLFVKERYYRKETSLQSKDPFWKSIQESARCYPLWMLIGITFFVVLGSTAVANLGQYLNIYYVSGGRLAEASIITGWKSTILVVTGIACIPLWTWLGEKFDKKTIVGVMLGASIFGHLLNIVCMTPAMPYLQLIPSMFESGAISAVWLFLPSMKGDVSDYDELLTTRRREGALNAFYSWFFKIAMTCSMGLSGFVLDVSGFDVEMGEQAPGVLQCMFWIYLVLPILIWGVGGVFVSAYPLNRARMNEIRESLEMRRGKL